MQIDVLDVLLTTVFANHIRGGSPFGNIGFNGGRSNPPREQKCFYWGGGVWDPHEQSGLPGGRWVVDRIIGWWPCALNALSFRIKFQNVIPQYSKTYTINPWTRVAVRLTFYCTVLSSLPSLVLPHALLGKAAGMEAQTRDPGFEKTLDT